jgi:hypothetical protein
VLTCSYNDSKPGLLLDVSDLSPGELTVQFFKNRLLKLLSSLGLSIPEAEDSLASGIKQSEVRAVTIRRATIKGLEGIIPFSNPN